MLLPLPIGMKAQCPFIKINHLTGTQTLGGCTSVTVTSEGSVGTANACGKGPYWAGRFYTGSYIFSFSPPVSGARISLYVINDALSPTAGPSAEEMRVEINGAFYPISTTGVADGCQPEAILTPIGTIRADPATDTGLGCAWDNIDIFEPISTLKVEDLWLHGEPNGIFISVYFCCLECITDAGQIVSGTLNVCTTMDAFIPDPTGTVLDNNDMLQYIMFTNPNDTLGSIIATSVAPVFSYDPAIMQTGVTYYVAAVAGNNAGGNVDFDDICLDISNAIPLIWRPRPTVQLSGANPYACIGDCVNIQATFTGTPPFNLLVSNPFGGNESYDFNAFTGTFQVCVPSGATGGGNNVEVLYVADQYCACP